MKECTKEELGRLTSKLLDGVISESEHSKLSKLLECSSHNRQAYLEYINLESLLHWESSESQAEKPADQNSNKLVLFRLPIWAGSIAAVFLAMTAIWWTYDQGQPDQAISSTYEPQTDFTTIENIKLSPANISFPESVGTPTFPQRKFLQSDKPGLQERSIRAINILEVEKSSPPEGVLEYYGPVKRLNFIHAMLTPAENGILPASGTSMMGFEKMSISVDSQSAQTEELVQVLDIREAIKGASVNTKTKIFAAVKFNQSFGDSQEGAEFGITLQAFKNEQSLSPTELIRTDQKVFADRDPSTWNELSSELEIPVDAEFVVVSLTARKHGPDSLLANTSSYYADDLELRLSLDNQTQVGPI